MQTSLSSQLPIQPLNFVIQQPNDATNTIELAKMTIELTLEAVLGFDMVANRTLLTL